MDGEHRACVSAYRERSSSVTYAYRDEHYFEFGRIQLVILEIVSGNGKIQVCEEVSVFTHAVQKICQMYLWC